MPLVTLDEKYNDINLNQYEAADIMWKKFDEVIRFCNFLETEVERLKEELKNKS